MSRRSAARRHADASLNLPQGDARMGLATVVPALMRPIAFTDAPDRVALMTPTSGDVLVDHGGCGGQQGRRGPVHTPANVPLHPSFLFEIAFHMKRRQHGHPPNPPSNQWQEPQGPSIDTKQKGAGAAAATVAVLASTVLSAGAGLASTGR